MLPSCYSAAMSPDVENNRLAWLRTTPVAHRGLHDDKSPENSIASFVRAGECAYGIELDIQMTRDGHPVVFHDDNAKRATGLDADISELDLNQVTALTLFGSSEKVPTLREVVKTVGRKSPLLIEIKAGSPADRVCPAVMESLSTFEGTFAIQSFDPRILIWFKKHAPEVTRVQLSSSFKDQGVPTSQKLILRSMILNVRTRPHGLAYDIHSMPSVSLTFWRTVLRCPVLFWTVRTSQDLAQARSHRGNVIFEHIQLNAI